MSSHSITQNQNQLLFLGPVSISSISAVEGSTSTPRSSLFSSNQYHHHHHFLHIHRLLSFSCARPKNKPLNLDIRPRCSAVSRPRIQEFSDVLRYALPVIKWPDIVENNGIKEEEALKIFTSNEIIKRRVDEIKSMLGSMEDGEISISAYDTAWVALVEDVNGSGVPQFPSSLHWIANNQLSDGSWGDRLIFSAHDRLINTLACVVALKSWNIHPNKCEKGMVFFKENLSKLGNENDEHMPIGFEVAFPSLLEIARRLDIQVPDNSPVLDEIYKKRDLKLTRIPREIMHNVATTLLHSLEGMAGLDWEKLLKLQCKDGSFLFSPSSTAFALMQTKDPNCLNYLTKAVQRFNGGVPNVYPVDMFEHMWAVDRLERLGISRYFQSEINECLDYVYRYWTEHGICWARNTRVQDIDDTAMGFRLLRLHGYEVSADVFRHFEKDGEFFCFAGQSNQAVTGMFNLYRASQVLFPGEKILKTAMEFSSRFLREKQAANQLLDKWIITKDLCGEVGYALEVPWYASLPRLESRLYIEQYGGQDDVWIGKTLYRMPYVSNNGYLELAKLDYNNCQDIHRNEWTNLQKWYKECELDHFGTNRRDLLLGYFVASANIYEPERSVERISWAKTSILVKTISSYLESDKYSEIQKRTAFLKEFRNCIINNNKITPRYDINGRSCRKRRLDSDETEDGLIWILLGTMNHISLDAAVAHGQDISQSLRQAWEKWVMSWEAEGAEREAELLVETINLSAGHLISEELLLHPQYLRLIDITNKICHSLARYQLLKVYENGHWIARKDDGFTTFLIEADMQELVQLVLQNSSDGIDSQIKQTFLWVARSFYYTAYCDYETINFHIAKVLFERIN